jgi:SepF-like predicted cell division protein (DUF552 family)
MKQFLAIFLFVVASAIGLTAQTAVPSKEEQVLAVLKQVRAEHVLIADNQAKLEAKAQEMAEIVQQARFFAARSGGPHIPPKK